jgi:predicted enzyme related to lactoylglutathione lyase
MPRPVHFELQADNPERAAGFYRSVFGWKVEKWNGPMEYWLFSTGQKDQPGIDGGMMKRSDGSQFGPTTNTIDVPSVDEFTAKITKSGGSIVMPKKAVPGVGWMAYCKDTEGNVFGIMQMDQNAK